MPEQKVVLQPLMRLVFRSPSFTTSEPRLDSCIRQLAELRNLLGSGEGGLGHDSAIPLLQVDLLCTHIWVDF